MRSLKQIELKYIGNGVIAGIPARDLTKEEAALYGADYLIGTGLYKAKQPKKKPQKQAGDGE